MALFLLGFLLGGWGVAVLFRSMGVGARSAATVRQPAPVSPGRGTRAAEIPSTRTPEETPAEPAPESPGRAWGFFPRPAETTSTPPPMTPDAEASVANTMAAPVPTADPGNDLATLRRHRLVIPVEKLPPSQLRDTFNERRGSRPHAALDILAPKGTPVIATDDGVIAKIFTSKAGGLTLYQFDPSETYCYYYAHLDEYAAGLREGMQVRKGERLGTVGVTGNAPPNTPHLHFQILRLSAQKRWWEGTPIDPYPLWRTR